MRYLFSATFLFAAFFVGTASHANELWRCPGNVYTNQVSEADKSSGRCKPVTTDVSVIAPNKNPTSTSTPPSGQSGSSPVYGSDPSNVNQILMQEAQQRNTRAVQAQIDQAVRQLNALEAEYNNGEPDRMGPEFRNYQMYLDRVERLKGEIEAKKQEIATLRTQL